MTSMRNNSPSTVAFAQRQECLRICVDRCLHALAVANHKPFSNPVGDDPGMFLPLTARITIRIVGPSASLIYLP